MKLRPSLIGGAITDWNKVQSNCYYDSKRCPQYLIPVDTNSVKELYWYLDLEKQPASVNQYMINACTGTYGTKKPIFYQYGKAGDNYYGVINGYSSLPYEQFVIAIRVTYADGTFQFFFSETYSKEKCANFDTVYACYNKNDNGGFDNSGIYTGVADVTYIGNPDLRYFHNYTIRNLKALYSGKNITYTTLNNRPTKSEIKTTISIFHEVVPYWYEQYTAQAFAKGIVVIDGYQYTISEYSSNPVGDACCERLGVTITAEKTSTVTFSCSTDLCEGLVCIPISIPTEDIELCPDDPTYSILLPITGTKPWEYEVIQTNMATTTIIGNNLRIAGPTQIGQYVISMENCDGIKEFTINFVAGTCCGLGTLTLEDASELCSLGTLNIQ